MAKRKIYVFDHIPKCAGSSLHSLFAKVDSSYSYISNSRELIDFAKTVSQGGSQRDYLIGGHCVYGVHELVGNEFNVEYFTFLRDPLKVAYSLYKFDMKIGALNYGSFIDYMYDHPCRYMTAFLGGTLERAVCRLEKYAFVGFVEDFARSVSMLLKKMGISEEFVPHHNVTNSSADSILTSMNVEDIKDAFWDCRLYDYFRKIYDGVADQIVSPVSVDYDDKVLASDLDCISRLRSGDFDLTAFAEEIKSETDVNTARIYYCTLSKMNLPMKDDDLETAIDKLFDKVCGAVNPSRISAKKDYDRIMDIHDQLMSYTVFDKDSVIYRGAIYLLMYLATTRYAILNDLDLPILRKVAQEYPFIDGVWSNTAMRQRVRGRIDEARSALSMITEERRWTTYYNEMMMLFFADGGAAADIGEFLKAFDPVPHYRASRFLERNFELSKRTRLADISGERILIMRSGPIGLLDDLLSDGGLAGRSVTLVLQLGMVREGRYSGYEIHPIADGWLDPYAHDDLLNGGLKGPFDAIILLCSDFASLNKLCNFVEFSRRIARRSLYAYPISNMYVPHERKTLIPINQPGV